MDWQSDEIPSSIRRPWEVLEQELDDQLEDAQGVLAVDKLQLLQEHTNMILQNTTPYSAFIGLGVEWQRHIAEVSLAELAAFAKWRAPLVSQRPSRTLIAEWNKLPLDEKLNMVAPEGCPKDETPRAVLSRDPLWSSLLVDGAPPCGQGPKEPLMFHIYIYMYPARSREP